MLTEYGNLSEDILDTLPPELAGSEAFRRLRSSLRALSTEGEDGVRLSLEIPLQAMLQSLNQLAIREERYQCRGQEYGDPHSGYRGAGGKSWA